MALKNWEKINLSNERNWLLYEHPEGAIIDTSNVELRNLRSQNIIYESSDYIDGHYTGGCIRNE